MIELRIFVELEDRPLILAQAVRQDGTITEEFVHSHDEALEWLSSVLGPDDQLVILSRPFQRL
jgi:hypothetical protein